MFSLYTEHYLIKSRTEDLKAYKQWHKCVFGATNWGCFFVLFFRKSINYFKEMMTIYIVEVTQYLGPELKLSECNCCLTAAQNFLSFTIRLVSKLNRKDTWKENNNQRKFLLSRFLQTAFKSRMNTTPWWSYVAMCWRHLI